MEEQKSSEQENNSNVPNNSDVSDDNVNPTAANNINQGSEEVNSDPETNNTDQVTSDDVEKNKVFAIVGYIVPILFFLPLVTEAKKSPFARFHANQQLNLLIIGVVLSVFQPILTYSFYGMFVLFSFLFTLIWLALLVFVIMGIINAANGKMKKLPLIGEINLLDKIFHD